MSRDGKGRLVFWISVAVLIVALGLSVYAVIYGMLNDKVKIWVAGLGCLGAVVYGTVRLYGHMRGPKP